MYRGQEILTSCNIRMIKCDVIIIFKMAPNVGNSLVFPKILNLLGFFKCPCFFFFLLDLSCSTITSYCQHNNIGAQREFLLAKFALICPYFSLQIGLTLKWPEISIKQSWANYLFKLFSKWCPT